MASFFNKSFNQPTIPQEPKQKLVLQKKDVVLNYINSRRFKNTYKFTFLVTILPIMMNFDNPTTRISARDLDMVSFRKAVIDNLKDLDKKYIEIHSLDTVKVEFVLSPKWIDDATRNIKSTKLITKFSKEFRLKVQLPYMVRFYCAGLKEWKEYVVYEFLRKLDNREIKTHFTFLGLLKLALSKIPFNKMFDWSYDEQWNKITGTMKPAWILSMLYAVGAISNSTFNRNEKIDIKKASFLEKAERNKDQFKDIKWSNYVSKNKKDLI